MKENEILYRNHHIYPGSSVLDIYVIGCPREMDGSSVALTLSRGTNGGRHLTKAILNQVIVQVAKSKW